MPVSLMSESVSAHPETVYFAEAGVARASAMLIYSNVNCASRNPRALVSTKYPRFWTYFAEAGVARASAMLIYSNVNCASRNPRALVSTKYPRFSMGTSEVRGRPETP